MTAVADPGLQTVGGDVAEPATAPSPAVAPPPGSPRFALFDALRGIAVLCIIAYHVTSITGAMNNSALGDLYAVLGNQALIFFFVISGFLLYRPYAAAHADRRRPPNAARYGRRRAFRILPAYWTALTLLAIFPGIVGAFSHDWWRYYFFLQDYSNRTLSGGIPPAWSLCVEVTFYLSLPLWALLVRRIHAHLTSSWLSSELWPLAAVALFGALVQLAASRLLVSQLLATSLLGECIWIALGMMLGVLSVADARAAIPRGAVRAVAEHPGLCWLGAAACLAAATAILHPGGLFNIIVSLRTRQPIARTLAGILLTAGLSAFLVAPAVFGEQLGGWPRRLLAWRPLAYLGVISYSVYLYHLVVAELLGERSDPSHFSVAGLGLVGKIHTLTTPLLFVLTLAGSVLLATASYYLIELPFLRRKEG